MSRKDPSFPATVTIQTSEILEGFINYLFRNPWITAKRKQEAEGRSLVWNSSDTALSHALLPATGSDSSYPWNKQLIPTSRMGSAPEPAPNCHGFAATETSGKSLCSKKDLSRKKRTQECLGSGGSSDPEPSHGVKTESSSGEARAAGRALCATGDPSWCLGTLYYTRGGDWRGPCRFPPHIPGTCSTSSREQPGSCSKGHCHTGLQICLSVKRPTWKKSPEQPPNLKVERFDPFRGL